MDGLGIRRAEARDIPALGEFARFSYARAFGHSFDPEDLSRHLTHNLSNEYFARANVEDVILIAERGSRLIGFVQFGTALAPIGSRGDQELRRIYVHPDFQGKGLGTALMDAALAHPVLRAAKNVYLDVWERNAAARALYERYGFAVVGAHKLALASGESQDDDLIMVRTQG
jgi:ribosomal protein S18 acetylase RimI-like enzyme